MKVRFFFITLATLLPLSAARPIVDLTTTTASTSNATPSSGWSSLPVGAQAGIIIGSLFALLLIVNGIQRLRHGPHYNTGKVVHGYQSPYPGRVEYQGERRERQRRVYAAMTPLQRARLGGRQYHEYNPYMLEVLELEQQEERRLRAAEAAKQHANESTGENFRAWKAQDRPTLPPRPLPAVSSYRFG